MIHTKNYENMFKFVILWRKYCRLFGTILVIIIITDICDF